MFTDITNLNVSTLRNTVSTYISLNLITKQTNSYYVYPSFYGISFPRLTTQWILLSHYCKSRDMSPQKQTPKTFNVLSRVDNAEILKSLLKHLFLPKLITSMAVPNLTMVQSKNDLLVRFLGVMNDFLLHRITVINDG